MLHRYGKSLLLTLLIMLGNPAFAEESILDSGKTPQEIAAEILKSGKERYRREQQASGKVTMYATSWCGYCKKARQYFTRKRIKYKEYNIESNYKAKMEYDQLGGRGVPLIVVGKRVMRGFSVSQFEELYSLVN